MMNNLTLAAKSLQILRRFSSSSLSDTFFATAGCEIADPLTGAVVSPIHFSTTYERNKETLELDRGFNYSRLSNPTRLLLEKTFAKAEMGKEGFAFSSGMQACTSLILACPDSHILLPDDLYHGVFAISSEIFRHWGMTFEKVDMTNHALVEDRLKNFSTMGKKRLILWMETPSNPQCKITDIEHLTRKARDIVGAENVCSVVDSTWCTPYLLRPLELGADFALHSTTKYVGGHSDMLGGMVVAGDSAGAQAVLPSLRVAHQIGGGVSSPLDSYLALRGLRSLHVRMQRHCESAKTLAEFLQVHPCVDRVFYPGLPSHPQHGLAASQMGGRFGGMLSLLVKNNGSSGGADEALEVVKSVSHFKRATSLGGTESLIEHRASVEGVFRVSPPNLLRLSIGLEAPSDLMEDLDTALRKAVRA